MGHLYLVVTDGNGSTTLRALGAGAGGDKVWLEVQHLYLLLPEWDTSSTTELEKFLGTVPAHRHPLLLSNIASILDIFIRVSVKGLCRELIKKCDKG